MDNYKIVEVKIILCLWSDVDSSYMVSSNPQSRGCVCSVVQYLHNKLACLHLQHDL